MATISQQDLEAALSAAGSAHHDYEQNTLSGIRDEYWPGFYAAYVLGRLGDFVTPGSLVPWLENAPENDDWAPAAAAHVLAQLAVSG